jgi:hypothetical protein
MFLSEVTVHLLQAPNFRKGVSEEEEVGPAANILPKKASAAKKVAKIKPAGRKTVTAGK